jgi:cell division protein FtsX
MMYTLAIALVIAGLVLIVIMATNKSLRKFEQL